MGIDLTRLTKEETDLVCDLIEKEKKKKIFEFNNEDHQKNHMQKLKVLEHKIKGSRSIDHKFIQLEKHNAVCVFEDFKPDTFSFYDETGKAWIYITMESLLEDFLEFEERFSDSYHVISDAYDALQEKIDNGNV